MVQTARLPALQASRQRRASGHGSIRLSVMGADADQSPRNSQMQACSGLMADSAVGLSADRLLQDDRESGDWRRWRESRPLPVACDPLRAYQSAHYFSTTAKFRTTSSPCARSQHRGRKTAAAANLKSDLRRRARTTVDDHARRVQRHPLRRRRYRVRRFAYTATTISGDFPARSGPNSRIYIARRMGEVSRRLCSVPHLQEIQLWSDDQRQVIQESDRLPMN